MADAASVKTKLIFDVAAAINDINSAQTSVKKLTKVLEENEGVVGKAARGVKSSAHALADATTSLGRSHNILGGIFKTVSTGVTAISLLTGGLGAAARGMLVLKFAAGGVAALLGAIAAKRTLAIGQDGAIIEQQNRAYQNILRNSLAADSVLAKIREVSDFTASDLSLQQTIIKAKQAGIAYDELGQLIKVARAASVAYGLDSEATIQRVIAAVQKKEIELLDELGIIVNQNTAQRRYAQTVGKTVDELNDYEKTQAFLNETLRKGQFLVSNVGDAVEGNANQWAEMNAKIGGVISTTKTWISLITSPIPRTFNSVMDLLFKAGENPFADRFSIPTRGTNEEGRAIFTPIERLQKGVDLRDKAKALTEGLASQAAFSTGKGFSVAEAEAAQEILPSLVQEVDQLAKTVVEQLLQIPEENRPAQFRTAIERILNADSTDVSDSAKQLLSEHIKERLAGNLGGLNIDELKSAIATIPPTLTDDQEKDKGELECKLRIANAKDEVDLLNVQNQINKEELDSLGIPGTGSLISDLKSAYDSDTQQKISAILDQQAEDRARAEERTRQEAEQTSRFETRLSLENVEQSRQAAQLKYEAAVSAGDDEIEAFREMTDKLIQLRQRQYEHEIRQVGLTNDEILLAEQQKNLDIQRLAQELTNKKVALAEQEAQDRKRVEEKANRESERAYEQLIRDRERSFRRIFAPLFDGGNIRDIISRAMKEDFVDFAAQNSPLSLPIADQKGGLFNQLFSGSGSAEKSKVERLTEEVAANTSSTARATQESKREIMKLPVSTGGIIGALIGMQLGGGGVSGRSIGLTFLGALAGGVLDYGIGNLFSKPGYTGTQGIPLAPDPVFTPIPLPPTPVGDIGLTKSAFAGRNVIQGKSVSVAPRIDLGGIVVNDASGNPQQTARLVGQIVEQKLANAVRTNAPMMQAIRRGVTA